MTNNITWKNESTVHGHGVVVCSSKEKHRGKSVFGIAGYVLIHYLNLQIVYSSAWLSFTKIRSFFFIYPISLVTFSGYTFRYNNAELVKNVCRDIFRYTHEQC
jgi:hypothetical protein